MTALDTYQSLITIKTSNVVATARDKVSAKCNVGVRVLSGVQAGSKTVLKNGRFTIGGSADSDIMLLDDDAMGPKIQVACSPSYIGTVVRFQTDRSDITVNGKPLKKSSEVCLPARLSFGSVELELYSASTTSIRQWAEVALFGALSLLSVAAIGWYLLSPQTEPYPQVTAAAATVPEEATEDVKQDDASLQLLDQMVRDAGLDPYIDVAQAPAGHLFVTGALPPQKLHMWERVLANFDRSGHGTILQSTVTTSAQLVTLPAIAVVRLGDNPQVILSDGRRLATGQVIIDDWQITEIAPTGLTLGRRGETVVAAF